MRSVLVTGSAGFIGGNFVQCFKKRFPKVKIIGLDDFSSGRRDRVTKDQIFYEGSIRDARLLRKIFTRHRPDYVFHFAAIPRVSYSVEQPVHTSEVNIIGTLVLLSVARDFGVKRFIYSSSSSVYGGAKKLPTKEIDNEPNPRSPYAAQKLSGEYFMKIWSDLFDLDTISLRYFNVFGPGQYGDSPYSTVISAWLETLYFNKRKPFVEGDGNQSRDFCYVDNVVEANISAMRSKKDFKGEVFNIAHNERITVNEVRRLIVKYTGRRLALEKRPPRKGDVRHTHGDILKAKRWFGYQPKVGFEEGLRRTVAWFEKRIR